MLKLGVVARLCIDHPLAATAPARPSASAQPRKAYPAWRSSASPAAPSNAVSHARLKCGSVRLSVADHEATASSRLRTTMLPFRVKGGSNLNSGIGLSYLPSMRPRVGFAPALSASSSLQSRSRKPGRTPPGRTVSCRSWRQVYLNITSPTPPATPSPPSDRACGSLP
jgi:hypothetical protein